MYSVKEISLNTENQPELLTVPETAAVLRLRPSTIRSWILKRTMPYVKIGRRVFLRRADLDALVTASIVPARNGE
jgi:excisionase family DNA binding protein